MRLFKEFHQHCMLAIIAVCAFWGCLPGMAAEPEDDSARQHTFVVAKVSRHPRQDYPDLQALADYLATRLADQGITRSEIRITDNNRAMAGLIQAGAVDLVIETPFSAAYLRERTGAEPIATAWYKGGPDYHTVIFVRKDSGIDSLDDLVGKVIAFEDPGSTSAYYLPAATLLNSGYRMTQLNSVRAPAVAGHIGFVFSDEEINSTFWVHKGLVDAAALSNQDWGSELAVPAILRQDLRVIFETPAVPRMVELVSPHRSELFKTRLRAELLAAHENSRGAKAIMKYKQLTRFAGIDEQMRRTLDELDVLMRQVRAELEL